MPDSAPASWSRAQRRLHWWVASLILIGFVIAWVMVALPLTQLLEKFLLYQVHKTIGLLVLALMLWRVLLRLRRGRPAAESGLKPWQRQGAAAMHAALYALAVLVPVLGYFVAATAPVQVPTFFFLVLRVPHIVGPNETAYAVLRNVHRGAAILLVVLACGHAAAAVQHHLRGRGTLRAMWRGAPLPR